MPDATYRACYNLRVLLFDLSHQLDTTILEAVTTLDGQLGREATAYYHDLSHATTCLLELASAECRAREGVPGVKVRE